MYANSNVLRYKKGDILMMMNGSTGIYLEMRNEGDDRAQK